MTSHRPGDGLRRVLTAAVLTGLILIGASCAQSEDELLNPSGGAVLWVAQTMSGRVTAGLNQTPVAGATVVFRVSLDQDLWIPLAQGTSGLDGSFSFSAASKNNPAGYWLLQPPNDGHTSFKVYWEVAASKSGVGQGLARSGTPLTRAPSKTAPVNPSLYQLQASVMIAPI